MGTYPCQKFRGSEVLCCQYSQGNDLHQSRKKVSASEVVLYRQLGRRTEAGWHITNVPSLIVKRAGVGRSSEDRHAGVALPVHLASVPNTVSESVRLCHYRT